MRASLLLVPALSASVWSAPTFPKITAAVPANVVAVSQYFNLVASKVQQSRLLGQQPVCDLSKVSLPAAAAGLPPPSAGFYLKHVAIGRGTQNYTCDISNTTAIPVAAGAVAALFNASCVVATYPDVANSLTRASLHFETAESEALQRLAPSTLGMSGVHYFTNATTPYFSLDTPQWQLGDAGFAKNAAISAPADAPKGLKGEGAVAWLKLDARPGATGGLQEVYRVETVGGSPPATCQGMPATFEIQYSTQYWFYASKS